MFTLVGATPLHHVCYATRESETTLQLARLLLARGADPTARDRFGDTPLRLCVNRPHLNRVSKLLLEFRVSLRTKISL